MNIDIDLSKVVIGACTFIITLVVHRNIKRFDSMDDKLDKLALDLAELKGSISGRFVLNDVNTFKDLKK